MQNIEHWILGKPSLQGSSALGSCHNELMFLVLHIKNLATQLYWIFPIFLLALKIKTLTSGMAHALWDGAQLQKKKIRRNLKGAFIRLL